MRLPRIEVLDLRTPKQLERAREIEQYGVYWDWPELPQRLKRRALAVRIRYDLRVFAEMIERIDVAFRWTAKNIAEMNLVMPRQYRPIRQWHWPRILWAIGCTLAVIFDVIGVIWLAGR